MRAPARPQLLRGCDVFLSDNLKYIFKPFVLKHALQDLTSLRKRNVDRVLIMDFIASLEKCCLLDI